jgi:hypothetical protein
VTRDVLDVSQPIALMLVSVLPFLVDGDNPAKILAALLAATHTTAAHDPDGWAAVGKAYGSAAIPGQLRDSGGRPPRSAATGAWRVSPEQAPRPVSFRWASVCCAA